MAENASSTAGKTLVIVESPAKARTISKFLGNNYVIEASIGHIRDLPQGAKELPEKYRGESWAYLGVDVDHDFEPVYIVPKEKKQQVTKLRDLMKEAEQVYLATDEDREGEAISWHLCQVLNPKVPVKRLVFHEITKEAILEALEHPRDIDDDLVRAQEVRRIVDRLYGYDVSPLLWRKIKPRLSAGRVQSVAVRLIVEREKQRMAFHSACYWDLVGTFATDQEKAFDTVLMSVGGRKIPTSRDFDSNTGQLTKPDCALLDEAAARALAERLKAGPCQVDRVDKKPYTSRPAPPFTTSTLQQEANRKYGFTARRTMRAAQSLYETGHITYMRTDSTNLAATAVEAARELVRSQFGDEYLPGKPRVYQTKVKNAQEAHEAIRPAGHPFASPDSLRGELTEDQFKLYDLIFKRTIASQMEDSRGFRTTIAVAVDDAIFQATGKTVEFQGYLRVYVESTDDPTSEQADRELVLPSVSVGENLTCKGLDAKEHTTKPPNRFSEASLTRTLEEMGIGRPSTYASIIDTILDREYVFKQSRSNILIPTWTAFAVVQLMENHLADLVNYKFTADMEDELDAISRGEMDHVEYLRTFYFGNSHPGLHQQLKDKVKTVDAREVCQVLIGTPESGETTDEIYVRVGRWGPYLQQGERRASLPEGMSPDEVTIPSAVEMLDKAEKGDEPLGECPETGRLIYVKAGRYGAYVQREAENEEEKPQNASLLKGMNPEDVNIDTAVALLSLPRTLGEDPESKEPIVAANGRYGPFVKCGDESRSLPPEISPIDVTLAQAKELLAQPKQTRRGAPVKKKEPIKVFAESPVTSNPVQLLDGRYGPYVTDGETNASLPRDVPPEEVTFESALDLLKIRAERGPSKKKKKKATKKKAAKKKTTKKKTTKKKTTKKKTTKKKAAKKKTAKKKAVKEETVEEAPFDA